MPSSGLGAYSVKINQVLFGGIFVAMVLTGTKALMFGSSARIQLLAAAAIGIAMVMALDNYYWILCPVLVSLGVTIPGLPFDGPELGCISLVGVYFIRSAMHKEHRVRFSMTTLIAFPLLAWIFIVWMLNPTGMTMLGSSSIGARFYFRIVVGFLALFVLSTLRLSERECKVLFICLVVTGLISLLNSIASRGFHETDSVVVGEAISQASNYYLLGALSLYLLVFARYSAPQILQSAPKLLLTIILAGLVVLSGKRQGVGTLFLTPIMRVFITRKHYMVTTVGVFIFAGFIFFGVAGHGSLWELPMSAQRGLSVVVPEFKTGSAMGTTDIFREGMRRVAREQLRQNPWLGRKGYAMSREATSWVVYSSTVGGDSMFEGHGYSGNWHNLWYAFACDFGIPCFVLFGLFVLCLLHFVLKFFPLCIGNEFMTACYLFYAYNLFARFVFATVAGHSSISLQDIFIKYGFILAIANGAKFASQNLRATASHQAGQEADR